MTTTRKVILEQQAINRKLWADNNGRMHHIDANKLIAEFMGHKLGLDGDGMGEQQCRIFEKGLGTKRIEDTYSKSWDWLMPVVEKIESLRNGCGDAYRFNIDMCNVDIENTKINITGTHKIKTTYQAVVEFIQTQTRDKDKEEALKYLSDKGYAVGSLWHIDDIQQGIECDDDTALKILNESLESDNVCEAVYETIDYIAINEYKLKIKE